MGLAGTGLNAFGARGWVSVSLKKKKKHNIRAFTPDLGLLGVDVNYFHRVTHILVFFFVVVHFVIFFSIILKILFMILKPKCKGMSYCFSVSCIYD